MSKTLHEHLKRKQALSMEYTIQEAAKLSGFSVSTLRYYDEKGVFPRMNRDEAGNRIFDDGHIEWLKYMQRLKKSGMTVGQISKFGKLISNTDMTLEERKAAALDQREKLEKKLLEILDGFEILDYSIWYCEEAGRAGGERALGEGSKNFSGTYQKYQQTVELGGKKAAADRARGVIDRYLE